MSEHDTVAVSICCCDETWHLRNEVSRLSGAGGGYLFQFVDLLATQIDSRVHYAACRVDNYSFTQMIGRCLGLRSAVASKPMATPHCSKGRIRRSADANWSALYAEGFSSCWKRPLMAVRTSAALAGFAARL